MENIKDKAKNFAIQAHMGQVRKSESDKPMIIHPIGVGTLLEELEFDDNVVAAGYLHDVVEDTIYTLEDIENNFGSDIASLVKGASEPDKSLSWEERKKHTINESKDLPLRNKAIIAADKINNLTDLNIIFRRTGVRNFDAFKRGEESQRWYYTSIYESLIYNEDENLPIFKKYKEILDNIFYTKENTFLKEVIFKNNEEYYEELKKLQARKEEIQHLKKLCSLDKPFVIEFSGTPRTGKTSIINNLYDFFKKGKFNISLIEEFTTTKYYKEELKEFSKLTVEERNFKIAEVCLKQLKDAVKDDKDIILIDRNINDRQIWNYRGFKRGKISEESYNSRKEELSKVSKELIDFLVVTYASPLISLKRDYNSSLALEDRSFLNIANIEEYNKCLDTVKDILKDNVEKSLFLDTSSISINDSSLEVALQILIEMRRKYIEAFKQKYNLK